MPTGRPLLLGDQDRRTTLNRNHDRSNRNHDRGHREPTTPDARTTPQGSR
jgi:hypothetical protein